MLKRQPHQAGIVSAVDRQGDGVAILDVAADRAGHRNRAAGLGRVDDVVGRDVVELMLAVAVVSTRVSLVSLAVVALPAASVAVTLACTLVSAARSRPHTRC